MTSCDEIDELVTKQNSKLRLADPSWPVEEALFKMVSGTGAAERYKVLLIDIMPTGGTEGKRVSPAEALLAAQALASGEAFIFAPRDIQESVGTW